MAITSYAGAIADTVWTTDKARVTTGVNSVTFQVALAGKPTSDALAFLYKRRCRIKQYSNGDTSK